MGRRAPHRIVHHYGRGKYGDRNPSLDDHDVLAVFLDGCVAQHLCVTVSHVILACYACMVYNDVINLYPEAVFEVVRNI